MSSVCTPILVGVVSLVSEIWLSFKNGQFSLSGHGFRADVASCYINKNTLQKHTEDEH